MKIVTAVVVLCLFALPLFAADAAIIEHNPKPVTNSAGDVIEPVPHAYFRPFTELNLNLNGGGYSPLSEEGRAGISGDLHPFFYYLSASYDNAHKSNDNANSTHGGKGHSTGLAGSVSYRIGTTGLYATAGASLSRTLTTDYNKQAYSPRAGGGYDVRGARLEGTYVFTSRNERVSYPDGTSCKCTNGGHGIDFAMWLPSPASRSHFLYHMDFTALRFHDTITDPSNPVLVASEGGNHQTSAWLSFGIIARW